MSMVNYQFGVEEALVVKTNTDFIESLGAVDGMATGTQHDALAGSGNIYRVGPPLDVERSLFQYDDSAGYDDGPVTVQGLLSNNFGVPSLSWGTCAPYLGARCVPGTTRGILLGLNNLSGSIALNINRLGLSTQGPTNTPSVLANVSGPTTPIKGWHGLKMVVRTIDKDTQIDVYRHFNVATMGAYTWVHAFTVLIQAGLAVRAWQHDPDGTGIAIQSTPMKGETLSVWGGKAGWGAGSPAAAPADPNNHSYVADVQIFT